MEALETVKQRTLNRQVTKRMYTACGFLTDLHKQATLRNIQIPARYVSEVGEKPAN